MGSKCPISLINAEAVIFHQCLSRQGGEEASLGIQFGLGAFNQTISCCMIHKTNLRPPENPRVRRIYLVLARSKKIIKMCSQRRSLPSRSVCGLWLMYSLARAVCVQTDNIVLQASVRQPYDACFGHAADTAVDSHKRRCPRGLVARRSP